jgi:glutaredoxin
MTEIEIYSAVLCPFAYRSRLTLSEKKVPFKLIEIDLQNKPANFGEISPFGKVPVLKHGKHRVWESAEGVTKGPRMPTGSAPSPSDPCDSTYAYCELSALAR